MHRPTSLIAVVAVAVLALSLAAVPDASARSAAADHEQLGRSLDGDALSAERPEADAPAVVGTLDASTPDAQALAAAADEGLADRFNDYCGDSALPELDLHRTEILDLRGTGAEDTLGVRFTTCEPLDAEALAGGIRMQLWTGADQAYLVDVYSDQGVVYGMVLGSEGPVDHAQLSIDGDTVTYGFPAEAIFPNAPAHSQWFDFGVGALPPDVDFDRDWTEQAVDFMPEPGETLGSWPDVSCLVRPEPRTKTVTPKDGATATALASMEAAGLAPSTPTADGRFSVTLADAADHDRLAALDGVDRVDDAVLYRHATGHDGGDPGGGDAEAAGASSWWRQQVDLAAADGVADGTGIEVAVIDDGVDGTRPELGGRVEAGHDVVRDLPIPAGANAARGGHGNHVAGLLAADDPQLLGAAPGATLRTLQAFDFGGCSTDAMVAAAIDEAVALGVDVVNLSLGAPPPIPNRVVDPGPLWAAIDRAVDAGVVLVAASGNFGERVPRGGLPAGHPDVIAVGATDHTGAMTDYTSHGRWLDLLAPGGSSAQSMVSLGERGGLVDDVGTSMAAPVVSGAVALHLETGGERVAESLHRTASPVPRSGHRLLDVGALLAFDERTLPGRGAPRIRDLAPACHHAGSGSFPDVPRGHTHAAGVDCMATWRIAGGFTDGTFRPGREVSRAQMATFVVRLIEETGGEAALLSAGRTTFPDVRGGAHGEAIERLAAAGIVSGHVDGTYRPQAPVTRAQMATFLRGAIEFRTGRELPESQVRFRDVGGTTHEQAIERIAAAGVTGGQSADRYGPTAPTTRGQMGSFLARTLAYLVEQWAAPAP